MAVEDFVAGAQRAADKITKEALEQTIKAAQDQIREAQDTMQMVETEQQRIAELAKQDMKGKKKVAAVAAETGRKAGKPTRKDRKSFHTRTVQLAGSRDASIPMGKLAPVSTLGGRGH